MKKTGGGCINYYVLEFGIKNKRTMAELRIKEAIDYIEKTEEKVIERILDSGTLKNNLIEGVYVAVERSSYSIDKPITIYYRFLINSEKFEGSFKLEGTEYFNLKNFTKHSYAAEVVKSIAEKLSKKLTQSILNQAFKNEI